MDVAQLIEKFGLPTAILAVLLWLVYRASTGVGAWLSNKADVLFARGLQHLDVVDEATTKTAETQQKIVESQEVIAEASKTAAEASKTAAEAAKMAAENSGRILTTLAAIGKFECRFRSDCCNYRPSSGEKETK